jgi:uncharacterized membrane protein YphA (DoxX/SURF4 family)
MSEETLQRFAPLVLRLGLVALFLWFGFSQVTNPGDWISWVPTWVPTAAHMDARFIVLINGGFEVICGVLLLLGIYVRWVALLLALHLFAIAYEIGYNDIGVRDFCLAISCISLSLFGNDSWTLQRKFFPAGTSAYSTLQ